MKRYLVLLITILLFSLTGCKGDEVDSSKQYYVLPDLNGYTVDEIETTLNEVNDFSFSNI